SVLLAASAEGTQIDTLAEGRTIWPVVWATDGLISYWDDTAERHTVRPPLAWVAQVSRRLPDRCRYPVGLGDQSAWFDATNARVTPLVGADIPTGGSVFWGDVIP